jgi:orotidine-5'-phosphate decarboxylase
VVIGRAITQAADPRAAFDAVCRSLTDEISACP